MNPAGECPLLSEEGLCRIQMEHGESYLSITCATYPRTIHTIDQLREETLSLSCPEAARLVLLSPRLLPRAEQPGYELTWDETADRGGALRPWFWPIRSFVVGLIQNRDYPLWQRLFLLGIFCKRLDALAGGEADRSFTAMLDEFSRAVAAGQLKSAMETIPADPALQLEMVLELIAQRVNASPITCRLRDVLTDFIAGIGHSRIASMESQAARYTSAYERYYAPFFRRQPWILENYLLNFVLRDVFPFAGSLFNPAAEPEPVKVFTMLAIQFSIVKGLLIGVAGARGRAFSTADVVRTVRAAFKHFEHNPQFLTEAYALLLARGMGDTRGLTMLLRN
jgi:lysine-N-methylase